MAYQTGVTSSVSDLVSTLSTFALSHGFTTGPTGVYTGSAIGAISATYDITSLLKGGVYFLFAVPRTGVAYLWMNTATAWDGTTWSGQHQVWDRGDNLVGPHVGYHLFSDGVTIHGAVEITTNVFSHITFGSVVKNGSWSGGELVGLSSSSKLSTFWSDITNSANNTPLAMTDIGTSKSDFRTAGGHVRSPIAGPTASFGVASTGYTSMAYNTAWAANCGRHLVDRSPNAANGRAVLVPYAIVQSSGLTASPFYQLGHIANACAVNIRDLSPKELVNTDWMVFPLSQKNGPSTSYPSSLNYGVAYKK